MSSSDTIMRLCPHCWMQLPKNNNNDAHVCKPRSSGDNLRSHLTGLLNDIVDELEEAGFAKTHLLQCMWTYAMQRRPNLATLVRPQLPEDDADEKHANGDEEDDDEESNSSSVNTSEMAAAVSKVAKDEQEDDDEDDEDESSSSAAATGKRKAPDAAVAPAPAAAVRAKTARF